MQDQSDASISRASEAPEPRDKKALWMLLAGTGIIRIISAVYEVPNGLFDDGYVTLRYAVNLVRGLGLVFNPGERVLGTTSPLFAFILAAAGRIVGLSHLETVALTVDILASIGMLYYSERILAGSGVVAEVKWTYLVILAFLPSFISNGTSGMETPVVLFLMSLSLYLCSKNRLIAVAIVGVLLFLSRVDTCIWLLALGIHILLTRRGRPMRDLAAPLILFLAGVSSWLLFTEIYYGSVVPQSIVGKAVSHGAFEWPDWSYVLTFLSGFISLQSLGKWGLAPIVIILMMMTPIAFRIGRDHPDLRPILYFFPPYVGLFLASRAPLFSWYLMPPKWAFYFLATYSMWFLLAGAQKTSNLPIKPAHVMAVFCGLIFILGIRGVRSGILNPPANTSVAISETIEQNVRPDGRIFLEHIGLIGYKTERYLYDSMGLVTPETTRLKRQYGADWLTRAAREFNADVVILYDTDMPAMESAQDVNAIWFRNSYRHAKDYSLPGLVISLYFKKNSDRILSEASRTIFPPGSFRSPARPSQS